MILELDPNDPNAEEDARQAVEDRNRPPIENALTAVHRELSGLLERGRLTPAELQSLITRYDNNFDQVLAEALRRDGRSARSEELQQAHRYAIGRMVDEAAATGLDVAFRQLGNVGVSLSYGPLNRFARDWAQQYSYELITRIDESTGRQVASHVSRWIESGNHLDALVRGLEPTFGRNRAEMIASTETTRAYAEGTLIGYRQSGVVIATEWKTGRDERVCPICRPLHGQRGDMDGNFEYNGQTFHPPAHVRCRCAVAPIVDEVLLAAPQPVSAPATTTPTVVSEPSATTPDAVPRVVIPRTPPTERTIDMAPSGLQYTAPEGQIASVTAEIDRTIERYATSRYNVTPEEMESVVDQTFTKLVTENNLAIQFKSQHLDSLLTDGRFKTQFETGASGGTLDTKVRSEAEQFGLGIPTDIDARQRPVYGYVDLGKMSRFNVQQYGDLTFIAKDALRERSTVTADDSLENMLNANVAGTPANAPAKVGWDRQVTALYDYAKSGDLTDITYNFSYIEVQVQGGVTLADMRAVVDAKGNLTEAQRQALQARGIEIWDK